MIEELVDNHFDGDPFGFGAVSGKDSVAEGGQDQEFDIVGGDVASALEEGAGFGTEDEVLSGAEAGAPADPLVDEIG